MSLSKIHEIVSAYRTTPWHKDVTVFGRLISNNHSETLIHDYGVGFVEIIAYLDPKRVGIKIVTLDDAGAHVIRHYGADEREKAERIYDKMCEFVTNIDKLSLKELEDLAQIYKLNLDIW